VRPSFIFRHKNCFFSWTSPWRPSQGEESDGGGDGPGDDLGEAEQASSLSSSSFGGEPKPEEKESQAAIQGEQGGSEEYETPAAAGGWADGLGKGDDRVPPKAPEAWGGGAASGRPVSKKLERLGNNHGLELDDRLAALLRCGVPQRYASLRFAYTDGRLSGMAWHSNMARCLLRLLFVEMIAHTDGWLGCRLLFAPLLALMRSWTGLQGALPRCGVYALA